MVIRNSARVRLLAATSLAVGLATSAAAQETPTSSEQAATSADSGLEEIVVTAQKRAQNLQDVPIAVSAFGGEDLERQGVTNVESFQFLAPSFSFGQSTGRRGSGLNMRGVGTVSFSDGVEQSVGTVVDGVVMGRQAQALTDFFDVERIEILRGPQGTVFGKNTSAGVVNIITRNPTREFEAIGQVSYGNRNDLRGNAAVSGPLTDTLSARITASYSDRDGFTRNLTTGRQVDGKEERGVRGKLLFEPSNDVSLLLAADYGKTDSTCCNLISRTASPAYLNVFVRNALLPGPKNSIVPSPTNREVAPGGAVGNADEGWGASVTANVGVGEHTLTSITAYREFEVADFTDVDQGPLNFFEFAGTSTEQDQLSQELRLTSPSAQPLQYVLGLYYFEQNLSSFTRFAGRLQSPTNAAGAPVDLVTTVEPRAKSRSYAAFGQATLDVTEAFDVTVGLRLTHEKLNVRQRQRSGFPIQGGGLNYDLPSAAFPNAVTENTDTDVSGKVALGYDFSDDVRLFASYTRGYKGAAFDTILRSSLIQLQTFAPVAPEKPEQIEVGFRSRLLDNRLQFNVTGFHTDIKNFQTQTQVPGVGFILGNADARTKGVEFELVALPTDGLEVSANLAYVDAQFSDYDRAQCFAFQTAAEGCVGGVQNLSGKSLNNSPKWSTNVAAQYTREVANDVEAYVRGELSLRSDVFFAITGDPGTRQDGYTLANFYAGAIFGGGRYEVGGYLRNAFDTDYATSIFSTPLDPAIVGGTQRQYSQFLGNPRTYGVRVTVRF